jgi:hypothetical protein
MITRLLSNKLTAGLAVGASIVSAGYFIKQSYTTYLNRPQLPMWDLQSINKFFAENKMKLLTNNQKPKAIRLRELLRELEMAEIITARQNEIFDNNPDKHFSLDPLYIALCDNERNCDKLKTKIQSLQKEIANPDNSNSAKAEQSTPKTVSLIQLQNKLREIERSIAKKEHYFYNLSEREQDVFDELGSSLDKDFELRDTLKSQIQAIEKEAAAAKKHFGIFQAVGNKIPVSEEMDQQNNSFRK